MRQFLLFALALFGLSSAEDVKVKLDGLGTMKGSRVDLDMGDYYYAFKGIRYAEAPTGKLRFKVRCLYN
jgi:hypothetical protein